MRRFAVAMSLTVMLLAASVISPAFAASDTAGDSASGSLGAVLSSNAALSLDLTSSAPNIDAAFQFYPYYGYPYYYWSGYGWPTSYYPWYANSYYAYATYYPYYPYYPFYPYYGYSYPYYGYSYPYYGMPYGSPGCIYC